MPPKPPNRDEEIKHLLEENLALAQENQKALKSIRRWGIMGFTLQIFWYAVLIGVPFALYFYILEPYFSLLGGTLGHGVEGLSPIKALGIIFGR